MKNWIWQPFTGTCVILISPHWSEPVLTVMTKKQHNPFIFFSFSRVLMALASLCHHWRSPEPAQRHNLFSVSGFLPDWARLSGGAAVRRPNHLSSGSALSSAAPLWQTGGSLFIPLLFLQSLPTAQGHKSGWESRPSFAFTLSFTTAGCVCSHVVDLNQTFKPDEVLDCYRPISSTFEEAVNPHTDKRVLPWLPYSSWITAGSPSDLQEVASNNIWTSFIKWKQIRPNSSCEHNLQTETAAAPREASKTIRKHTKCLVWLA